MFAGQLAIAVLVMSLIMAQFYGLLATDQERDRTEVAAVQLAQVTQAVASRMFEMGSRFVSNPDYASGTPPGPAGSLGWLKNSGLGSEACGIAGLPALPTDELGNPVDDSFLPCDAADTDLFGNGYAITWNQLYPGTRTNILVGTVPFAIEGERRDDIGGAIALKAARHSLAGLGDSTLDVMVRYDFDPDTSTLRAIIDRTSPFAADPHLRIDGSNPMDAVAGIVWGNGMFLRPTGNAMELSAAGGITLRDNTGITGDLAVTGTATMREGVVTGVQIAGAGPARATLAVYDQRINKSGDVVEKPTCPGGSTAQIYVAVASLPIGEGVVFTDSAGNRVSGSVKGFRTLAADLGTQWQVWAEVELMAGAGGIASWIKLGADDGDLRSSIKCT